MTNNQQINSKNQNKVRNRLVGFAALLLIIAVFAPWILTDKSNLRASTTPILQPEVVTQQNQNVASPNDIDENFTNNLSETPYLPDSDQDLSSLVATDIVDDPDDSTTIIAPSMLQQESKPYLIQLTALKNKQKIEELVALLRLNNYSVRTIPQRPEPNQLIKLQVGPYAKKEQAEQVIINLNNLTKLKGIIVAN
ncbi:MAG: SPOR domain-containing protein [Gilliamella sp.]|uniref:SPOR domain-containing protein n=1 Tax=Gilliamella sp. TaxID=1891236 RepID=UPI0026015118|nr:SPOR domain-containing protein [Gilliamella sp.]MCO6544623.1 SPOR domain-containing protein [Gilliamella sp.]MCO6547224.1 SPOR domain-containing protein [Gilliamella sp.]